MFRISSMTDVRTDLMFWICFGVAERFPYEPYRSLGWVCSACSIIDERRKGGSGSYGWDGDRPAIPSPGKG